MIPPSLQPLQPAFAPQVSGHDESILWRGCATQKLNGQ